jgi:hypothetical protein
MKKAKILILILGWVITSFAQVPTHMFDKGKVFEKHPEFKVSQINSPEKKMPAPPDITQ